MKRWLVALILLTGCAAKHKPVLTVVPPKCITGATLSGGCKQISPSSAVCDGVIVKFECVTFIKEKR